MLSTLLSPLNSFWDIWTELFAKVPFVDPVFAAVIFVVMLVVVWRVGLKQRKTGDSREYRKNDPIKTYRRVMNIR